MTTFFKGQKVKVLNDFALGFTREKEVVVKEVAPRTSDNGFKYMGWENGLEVYTSAGNVVWLYQSDVEPVLDFEDLFEPKVATKTPSLKNKVEIKDDIAIIHVTRKGYDRYVIVDAEELSSIERVVKNRLNIDSNGFVQHKQMIDGVWDVFQLHRFIAGAVHFTTVGFRNGNKLDLRKSNLIMKDIDTGKEYEI